MSLTTYGANALLDHMFKGSVYSQPAAIWMSLHTAAPGDYGTSEVAGGSYARKDVTTSYGAAAAKQKANTSAIAWAGMPAVTVTHVGVWDASTAGNLLLWGKLSVAQAVGAGETLTLSVGAAPMLAT